MAENNIQRLLVVCMGNICRSPTGEAVLKHKIQQRGLNLQLDSAGTIGYHAGSPPDARARKAGEARGYDFSGQGARRVRPDDFAEFDLILAMDYANLQDLQEICPNEHQHKLKLFLSYGNTGHDEVPDPYYGGTKGFEMVLDLIEQASDALLDEIS